MDNKRINSVIANAIERYDGGDSVFQLKRVIRNSLDAAFNGRIKAVNFLPNGELHLTLVRGRPLIVQKFSREIRDILALKKSCNAEQPYSIELSAKWEKVFSQLRDSHLGEFFSHFIKGHEVLAVTWLGKLLEQKNEDFLLDFIEWLSQQGKEMEVFQQLSNELNKRRKRGGGGEAVALDLVQFATVKVEEKRGMAKLKELLSLLEITTDADEESRWQGMTAELGLGGTVRFLEANVVFHSTRMQIIERFESNPGFRKRFKRSA